MIVSYPCEGNFALEESTSFSPPAVLDTAKNNLLMFDQMFAGPVYPTPYRKSSGVIYVLNGWDIVEASYHQSPPPNPGAGYIKGLLTYFNSDVAAMASTSVSMDVLQAGAPSVWNFFASLGEETRVDAAVQDEAIRFYSCSFVRAYYINEADASLFGRDETFVAEDEDAIRAEAVRALAAVGAFMGWTDQELARAGSFRRSSIYNWERGTKPQASKVANLFAIDALISALRRKLGDGDARVWLDAGDPSRRARLLEGDIQAVSSESETLLFPLPPAVGDEGFWVDLPTAVNPP